MYPPTPQRENLHVFATRGIHGWSIKLPNPDKDTEQLYLSYGMNQLQLPANEKCMHAEGDPFSTVFNGLLRATFALLPMDAFDRYSMLEQTATHSLLQQTLWNLIQSEKSDWGSHYRSRMVQSYCRAIAIMMEQLLYKQVKSKDGRIAILSALLESVKTTKKLSLEQKTLLSQILDGALQSENALFNLSMSSHIRSLPPTRHHDELLALTTIDEEAPLGRLGRCYFPYSDIKMINALQFVFENSDCDQLQMEHLHGIFNRLGLDWQPGGYSQVNIQLSGDKCSNENLKDVVHRSTLKDKAIDQKTMDESFLQGRGIPEQDIRYGKRPTDETNFLLTLNLTTRDIKIENWLTPAQREEKLQQLIDDFNTAISQTTHRRNHSGSRKAVITIMRELLLLNLFKKGNEQLVIQTHILLCHIANIDFVNLNNLDEYTHHTVAELCDMEEQRLRDFLTEKSPPGIGFCNPAAFYMYNNQSTMMHYILCEPAFQHLRELKHYGADPLAYACLHSSLEIIKEWFKLNQKPSITTFTQQNLQEELPLEMALLRKDEESRLAVILQLLEQGAFLKKTFSTYNKIMMEVIKQSHRPEELNNDCATTRELGTPELFTHRQGMIQEIRKKIDQLITKNEEKEKEKEDIDVDCSHE